ncbi:hypothetical protein BCF33_1591 [Hasllibacter halocynthiae]|uniref:Beta-lactamase n=1 Tax=Hasllibacter halocynthiae TaxID=595589 RepID=A0A2T0X1D8_9RHOB|nr:hypothetical protein [Hasllibacter halocynthiae]PRY92737.1 hypothetical protein BCF33_1591 [Hasllibacter halocynthiae]
MRRALAFLALLGGCASAGTAPVATAPAPVPAATGVEIPGTGREIGFGRTLESAEASLARLYGAPERRACAGGAILVSEGIELHFTGFGFSGWRTPAASRGTLC